jgi:hypothetical protein
MRRTHRRRPHAPNVIGVLVALVAVAGIGYLLVGELRRESPESGATEPVVTSESTEDQRASALSVVDSEPTRSETILTCTAADGQVFYTNATRCEDADLDNRVNVLATPTLPASRPTNCLGAQPGEPQMHGFLALCREPFIEALKLEPLLLESPDPAGSTTARRYCAFITEGVQAGCMATSDQFCFLHVCQALRENTEP